MAANRSEGSAEVNIPGPPTVSVIVPNYNHARFLPQRLDSVLGQTFQDFEVLILDDASTDDSREIIDAYAARDPRIRTCFNERNSGCVFKQWNRGVTMARGEYGWIAESDDYADAKLVETLVGSLRSHPGAGLAYCQSVRVDERGRSQGLEGDWVLGEMAGRWHSSFVTSGRDEVVQYLLCRNTIPNASAVVFRRQIYWQAGGADPSYRLIGDWATWLRMLLVADVAYHSVPLNYFRHHPGTVRATALREGIHLREHYRLLDDVLRTLDMSVSHRESVLNSVADGWIRGSLKGAVSWSPEIQRAILDCARKVDPAVRRRLCRRLWPVVWAARCRLLPRGPLCRGAPCPAG